MYVYDDNVVVFRQGTPGSEQPARVAARGSSLLVLPARCAIERGLSEGQPVWCDPATGQGRQEPATCRPTGTVEGVRVGCFPDLYAALAADPPDQVITL